MWRFGQDRGTPVPREYLRLQEGLCYHWWLLLWAGKKVFRDEYSLSGVKIYKQYFWFQGTPDANLLPGTGLNGDFHITVTNKLQNFNLWSKYLTYQTLTLDFSNYNFKRSFTFFSFLNSFFELAFITPALGNELLSLYFYVTFWV